MRGRSTQLPPNERQARERKITPFMVGGEKSSFQPNTTIHLWWLDDVLFSSCWLLFYDIVIANVRCCCYYHHNVVLHEMKTKPIADTVTMAIKCGNGQTDGPTDEKTGVFSFIEGCALHVYESSTSSSSSSSFFVILHTTSSSCVLPSDSPPAFCNGNIRCYHME